MGLIKHTEQKPSTQHTEGKCIPHGHYRDSTLQYQIAFQLPNYSDTYILG